MTAAPRFYFSSIQQDFKKFLVPESTFLIIIIIRNIRTRSRPSVPRMKSLSSINQNILDLMKAVPDGIVYRSPRITVSGTLKFNVCFGLFKETRPAAVNIVTVQRKCGYNMTH